MAKPSTGADKPTSVSLYILIHSLLKTNYGLSNFSLLKQSKNIFCLPKPNDDGPTRHKRKFDTVKGADE